MRLVEDSAAARAPIIDAPRKLAQLARRRAMLDRALVLCWAFVGTVCSAAGYSMLDPLESEAARVAAAALAGLAAMGLAAKPLAALHKQAVARLAPTWFLDVRPNVIRVVGRVAPADWAKVRRRMLAARPGLVPAENAPSQFGCAMAAVAAPPSRARAQQLMRLAGALVRC